MRTRHLRAAFAVVLVATMLLAWPAGAAPLVTGVIIAGDTTAGQAVMFNAFDGSGRTVLPYFADVTHAGPWEVLHLEAAPNGNRLFVAGPAGDVPLTEDVGLTIVYVRWSISGARVAWTALHSDGTSRLYAADVERVEGLAVGLSGVTAVRQLPSAHTPISWADDDRRVALTMDVPVPGSSLTQADVFVVDTATGTATNLTNSPSINEYHPAFSPVQNRIAFVRRTSKGGPYRNDIFVLDLNTRRVTQVTTKNNANVAQIMQPAYSPDGTAIAFAAWPASGFSPSGIYRIAADGSGKAVSLTGAEPHAHAGPQWRRALAAR